MKNAIGRELPESICGRQIRPYGCVTDPVKTPVQSMRCHKAVRSRTKLVGSLREAIEASGLRDGMTISFHHCFREGDRVIGQVLSAIRSLGIGSLRFAPSAVVNLPETDLVSYIEDGTIDRVEASGIRGPLGNAVLHGKLPFPAVLRPHGARPRAIEAGELKIDVAFIGASAADDYGNCTGLIGPNACGSLGYAFTDAMNARCVIVVTDNLVPYPCIPVSISQMYVDYVVQVDNIGDTEKIATGAARLTRNPRDLLIAERAASLIAGSRRFKNGFSFQTGAGAISIAATAALGRKMREKEVTAGFALGGITAAIIDLYDEGLVRAVACSQSFDAVAARSILDRPGVIEIDNADYAHPFTKGGYLNREDFGVLGALEVDLDFNVNILQGASGEMMGGLGGGPDVAGSAGIPIITMPIIRGRIPSVVERVSVACTPGKTVAAVVTEAGIALNPKHSSYEELREDVKGTGLKIVSIEELHAICQNMTGKPDPLRVEEKITCIVEYRDGTVLDVIRQLSEK